MPNGSPFEHDKQDVRLNLAVARVTETGLPLIYCNQVGGQDELVFDGASFVLNADRRLVAQAKAFEEDLLITRWRRGGDGVWACVDGRIEPAVEGLEAIYRAMCLGLRDYVDKNGFPGVVLGLSGGIDSALSRRSRSTRSGPRRSRGADAVALHRDREQRGRRGSAAGARHAPRHDPDRAGGGRVRRHARAGLRRPPARHHRGEPAGAHPRRAADGAVQQVRRAAADHRQQVRDVGRLRDALRRHVRRLRGAEGPVQDDVFALARWRNSICRRARAARPAR